MRHTTRVTRVTIAFLSIFGLGLSTVSVAQADPKVTVDDVKAAFDKVEASSEAVNQLGENIKATKSEIATLNDDIARDEVDYQRQREQLSSSIVQQQLDAPLGPTVSLLGSDNPTEFLDGLGAIQALNSTRAEALESFGKTRKELLNRKTQLKDRQADLTASKTKAKAKQADIRKHYDAAKAELARLSKPKQVAFNKSDTTVDFDVNASGRAKKAIDFALAQLGDPYSWGGNGPNAWDCSGLTQGAYSAAGVSLGRTTQAQIGDGHSVSMGALKPGDLVFFSSVQHVGIYLGNGRVVHAPRPGKSVEIIGVGSFDRATRVVG